MKKKLLPFVLVLILSACNTLPSPTKIEQLPKLNPNLPVEVVAQPVQIKPMTTTDLRVVSGVPGTVLYTLTPAEFEKLSGNVTEMYRYILQAKELIKFYREQNNSTQTTK